MTEPISVKILEVTTGIIREYKDNTRWHDSLRYWWGEGNGSCDCNRRWFFQDAGDEERDEDPPCGDERYRVLGITSNTGEVLWKGDLDD